MCVRNTDLRWNQFNLLVYKQDSIKNTVAFFSFQFVGLTFWKEKMIFSIKKEEKQYRRTLMKNNTKFKWVFCMVIVWIFFRSRAKSKIEWRIYQIYITYYSFSFLVRKQVWEYGKSELKIGIKPFMSIICMGSFLLD